MNDETRITSPTGLGIRNDEAGSGYYGSPRGRRKHDGMDFLCVPGQTVRCPIESGRVEREARPYVESHYSGLLIKGKHLSVKLFYILPWPGIIGQMVSRGDAIGIAQAISEFYNNGMQDHVHLAVTSFNPHFLMEKEQEE